MRSPPSVPPAKRQPERPHSVPPALDVRTRAAHRCVVTEGRHLDACSPIFLWPEADPSARGLVVETRIEHDSMARGYVTLELTETEHDAGVYVNVVGEPVSVSCSLETGECTAHDHDSARFLFEHLWLKAALSEQLHHLQRRAQRGAAQADRETVAARALAEANAGTMIAYDALFPADWDLVVMHEDAPYWVVDLYCHNPQCTCTEVTVSFYKLATGASSPPYIGEARLEIGDDELNVVKSSPEVDELVAELLDEYEDRLVDRHAEARRSILRFGRSPRQAKPAALPQAGRIPRNAMCPAAQGRSTSAAASTRRRHLRSAAPTLGRRAPSRRPSQMGYGRRRIGSSCRPLWRGVR